MTGICDTRYWPREFITEFIEEYKKSPCLWQMKSKQYNNKTLKNAAYAKLTALCKTVYPHANRDFAVKKIQSLRGSFRKENKKKKFYDSNVNSQDVYIPSLWYYDLLLFTADQDSTTNDENSNQDEDESSNNEEFNFEFEEKMKEELDEEYDLQDPQVTGDGDEGSQDEFKEKNKRKRLIEDVEKNKETLRKNKIDEYDAVGINVTAKLRRMDPIQAIYAEALINQVLCKGLLKKITSCTKICEQ